MVQFLIHTCTKSATYLKWQWGYLKATCCPHQADLIKGGYFSRRPDPHSVGEERCGGDELDRWRQSSRCFPLVGIASSDLPHITSTSIEEKNTFSRKSSPQPICKGFRLQILQIKLPHKTRHFLDLLSPGGRSVPKLSPELLEEVTCSKKGLKLSSSNIWPS